jgi:hypothetical protein
MIASRREFLQRAGSGFGTIALASLLTQEGAASPARANWNGGIHHPAKVRRVIQLFMNGGVSQMDTFDYKPELERRHGERVDFGLKTAVTSAPGPLMKCPFKWRQHGESGRWVSEVFAHTARHVDEMAFLMAMSSKTNVHGPASYMQNTGFLTPGFPSVGAWISYGLGSLNDNLPAYVVIPDHRGLPYNNTGNFSAGFLPAAHGATLIKPSSPTPISHLNAPQDASEITAQSETDGLQLLRQLNHQEGSPDQADSRLEARIKSFELAARMQLSAPEALDLSQETSHTLAAYGLDDETTASFGRSCLVARRLLERSVRFVQLWSGMGGPKNNWDNHADIPRELPYIARTVDQPIAALLGDLKQRGLLEDTLVIWTTEFGRMPFSQGSSGRDHNGGTFVTWLAGAGIKPGATYGTSDAFAFKAEEGVSWCYDLHATVLHLLGIDHRQLTFRHNGIDRRLTDVHGHVIQEVVA